MKILAAGLISGAVAVGALTLASADAGQAAACDWRQQYASTLQQLGEDPSDWSVNTTGPDWAGIAHPDSMTAEISTNVQCGYVPDIIKHEWAHLQQFRQDRHYHDTDDMERQADCAAQQLGGRALPYITPDSPAFVGGCTEQDDRVATALIGAYR